MAQGGDMGALRLFPEIRDLFLDGVSDEDPRMGLVDRWSAS